MAGLGWAPKLRELSWVGSMALAIAWTAKGRLPPEQKAAGVQKERVTRIPRDGDGAGRQD